MLTQSPRPKQLFNSDTRIFLFLSALFLGWRFLYFVFVHPDQLLVYPYEELYRGAVAKELIEGLKMSWFSYRQDDYVGAFYVLTAFISLLFRIFGMTAFALKLAPLFISFSGFILWYFAVKRFVGARVAFIFGLLSSFSFLPFLRISLSACATHGEAVIFTGAIALLALRMIYEEKQDAFHYALLGLIGGFGTWLNYVCFAPLVTALVFFFLRKPGFVHTRAFWVFPLMWLIGFSPWFYINSNIGYAGLAIRGDTPIWQLFEIQHFMGAFLHWSQSGLYAILHAFSPRSWTLLSRHLYSAGILIFSAVVFLPAAAAWLKTKATLREKNLRPVTYFIIDFIVFTILIQALTLEIHQRYIIPLVPTIYVLFAFGMDRSLKIASAHRQYIYVLFVGGVYILLNVIPYSSQLSFEKPGHLFSTKGYSYELLLDLDYCEDHYNCIEQYKRVVPHLSPEDQAFMAENLAARFVDNHIFDESLGNQIIEFSALLPVEVKKYYYFALGEEMADQWSRMNRITSVLEQIRARVDGGELYASMIRQGVDSARKL